MTSSPSPSNSSFRGEVRPVRRRTRTFRPNYLSFSGTYQCNLTCAHCSVPIEWPDRLPIDVALRFLEQSHEAGIETVSFTGGEPFLYPEFVVALTRRAAQLHMRFDKVQTNGVWHDNADHLRDILTQLRDAGFTGKLGLSVDKFHGKHTAKAAEFCRIAKEVFGRDNIVSLSYASRTVDEGLEPVRALAKELDGIIDWSDWLHRYMLVTPEMTLVMNWNHLAPVERAERLSGAWDGEWFEEDYCEGPGQALIVTPRGEVKPCCGFASDLEQLTIGNIHNDSVEAIIRRARKHPYVGKIFREGLTAIRDEILQREPEAFPEATSNHCFFCWYVLTKNLVAVSGNMTTTRLSLPMAGEVPPAPGCESVQTVTAILMAFDGKTVYLWEEMPRKVPTRGQVYLVSVSGSEKAPIPAETMTWGDYQAWIDRMRGEGYTLTTHEFTGCQGKG